MLNKKAIINRTREKLDQKYTRKELQDIIEAYNYVIVDALAHGEEAFVSGFGKFFIKLNRARKIANAGIPWLKGKTFISEAKLKVCFKPAVSVVTKTQELHAALKNDK
jgi:nucleoid DNA-binding protein